MTDPDNGGLVGVWLIGARGSVATTAITGAAALRDRIVAPAGCVTESPEFPDSGLPEFAQLVFGGHDVAETPLRKRAEQLEHAGLLPRGLPELVSADLSAADSRILPGIADSEQHHDRQELVAELVRDLRSFRRTHGLDRVVVVNLSDTEAPHPERAEHSDLRSLRRALREQRQEEVLAPSSLYACAALLANCSYADFTPSTGARLPALDELARRNGVPYAGSDGKTGETLVKSALLPMFSSRALHIRSWSGTNLLGGGDGRNLSDPTNVTSKTSSKHRVVDESLGYPVDGRVHIDYVPDLGESKTAWDHISFAGFLGNGMTMQFTWQGRDSALAAPLVLDLARLLSRAHERGHRGALRELGFFFKDPVGLDEHRLPAQFEMLRSFARELGKDE
ncbi:MULTISPECIES: inositol-3-phosphate synthase [unclassified Actinopolyspora]|uniref:inositol-3-phosphate synthase n=1 Tax=unclassified Actinopolyspora TaxID=2639451 RepID=UPI0013F5DF38|nr:MULTISPECIES: inositol-3-phosphate synthase [unclassified Actinopolyspora]NHD19103.1 myo-inositol-1-phosphate synthase [Actinopolyspora sp. BKK2]NHE78112.1 myo-inositol-1-phosphate synthase [Actinopolyspora sp. BKK1]